MSNRKSKAEHLGRGTFRGDRDKAVPAFTPSKGARVPAFLRTNKVAAQEWKRAAAELEQAGVLKEIDLALLSNYALIFARWRAAADDVERNGQVIWIEATTRTGMTRKPIPNPAVRNEINYSAALLKVASKLGISPVDRGRVQAVSPFDQDEGSEPGSLCTDLEDYA